MDETSLTGILTMLGFGKYAAGLASILIALAFIVSHLIAMGIIPPPKGGGWYSVVYGVLNKVSANYGKAKSVPPPDSGVKQ